jgi:hypothetical protein
MLIILFRFRLRATLAYNHNNEIYINKISYIFRSRSLQSFYVTPCRSRARPLQRTLPLKAGRPASLRQYNNIVQMIVNLKYFKKQWSDIPAFGVSSFRAANADPRRTLYTLTALQLVSILLYTGKY